jgi:hypothetical protein
MNVPLRFLCSLWPGSLSAWRHGDLRSLVIAIFFGLLLSFGWTATVIWPMWWSAYRIAILWSIAGLGAAVSVIHSAVSGLLGPPLHRSSCPDATLIRAQSLYLQADYFEAEQAIAPYCQAGALDAEAALLMASILRRTGRLSHAIALLDEVALRDCGLPWLEEIDREKRLSRQQKVRSKAECP